MGWWDTIKKVGKIALPVAAGLALGPVGGAIGGALGGAFGKAAGAAGQKLGGQTGNLVSKVFGAAKNNPELVLGAIGAIGNAKDASRRAGMETEALNFARQQAAMRAPLQQAAIARLQAPLPQRVDLSSIFADRGNPYFRPVRGL